MQTDNRLELIKDLYWNLIVNVKDLSDEDAALFDALSKHSECQKVVDLFFQF
jgi:hypothetical protein